jgi:predicted alpha/beta superfamily hydrolase
MPLEDPRETHRDIERLDTDYDPPPQKEENDNGTSHNIQRDTGGGTDFRNVLAADTTLKEDPDE